LLIKALYKAKYKQLKQKTKYNTLKLIKQAYKQNNIIKITKAGNTEAEAIILIIGAKTTCYIGYNIHATGILKIELLKLKGKKGAKLNKLNKLKSSGNSSSSSSKASKTAEQAVIAPKKRQKD
jgi:hypothetical protein